MADVAAAPAAGAAAGGDVATPVIPTTSKANGRATNGQFSKTGDPGAVIQKETATPPPVKLKVKYKEDGKDYEEELDEESAANVARQAKWAQRSAQKAKELERQVEELFSNLKDPRQLEAVMKKLGHDPDKWAEDRVANKYLPKTLTPEQLQQYELQQQLKQRDDELNQYKTKEQRFAEEQADKSFRKTLDEQLGEVAKLDRVPKNPRALARLADIWEAMTDNGYQPTPKELEGEIFSTYQADFKGLRGDKKGAALLRLTRDLMGDDVITEIQRAALAEWREKKGGAAPQNPNQPRNVAPKNGKVSPEMMRKPGESFEDHWARLHGG